MKPNENLYLVSIHRQHDNALIKHDQLAMGDSHEDACTKVAICDEEIITEAKRGGTIVLRSKKLAVEETEDLDATESRNRGNADIKYKKYKKYDADGEVVRLGDE